MSSQQNLLLHTSWTIKKGLMEARLLGIHMKMEKKMQGRGGGGAGEWKTIEEFSCSRGGFSSGSSRNVCYMCREAEHIGRECSLCGLGETYDGAVGESVGAG